MTMAVVMVMDMVVGRRSIRVLSSVSVERGIVVDSCGRTNGKVRSDVSIVFLFCFSIALHGHGQVYSIYHSVVLLCLQLSVFCLSKYPIVVFFSCLFFSGGWYHTYHITSNCKKNGSPILSYLSRSKNIQVLTPIQTPYTADRITNTP